MARPIPRHLLIHSVTHRVGTPDMYGNTIWTDTTISRVRVEPVKNTGLMVANSIGEMQQDKYLMFWDVRNSTPATFSKLDRIIFDGVEMTIRNIDNLYDENGLHHLEIALS